jgi:flagellar assembly protein FliH
MDGFAHFSRTNTLFAEDFDMPGRVPEPEVIEPTFSIAELAEAREAAWREGRSAGLQEAAGDSAGAIGETVAAISAQLAAERAASAAHAEHNAEAIARLLLDSLAAAFPALCTRFGNDEVQALVRIVLPALSQEPAIVARANPRTAASVMQEVAHLAPELMARVQTIECDDMAPGDVRVTWRNGMAVRDAGSLWEQVAQVLVPIREADDGG